MAANTELPFVTVICTCFNHKNYVLASLASVLRQTYANVELIVVDNASTDGSTSLIKEYLQQYPKVKFIANATNIGICKAFNQASKLAKGKYLIDLAADDLLMPDRIELQVAAFEGLESNYGLLYSNVEEISADGHHLRFSIPRTKEMPNGFVFPCLLQTHFIPSPSTLFLKSVFDELGGYNEELAFEDFDFWVRCSYQYKFHYLPIVSTKKRVLDHSLSTLFYSTKTDKMFVSTFITYLWAKHRLRDPIEHEAWNIGVDYYFRQAVFLGHFKAAQQFLSLGHKSTQLLSRLARFQLKHRINLSYVYQLYIRIRQ